MTLRISSKAFLPTSERVSIGINALVLLALFLYFRKVFWIPKGPELVRREAWPTLLKRCGAMLRPTP